MHFMLTRVKVSWGIPVGRTLRFHFVPPKIYSMAPLWLTGCSRFFPFTCDIAFMQCLQVRPYTTSVLRMGGVSRTKVGSRRSCYRNAITHRHTISTRYCRELLLRCFIAAIETGKSIMQANSCSRGVAAAVMHRVVCITTVCAWLWYERRSKSLGTPARSAPAIHYYRPGIVIVMAAAHSVNYTARTACLRSRSVRPFVRVSVPPLWRGGSSC